MTQREENRFAALPTALFGAVMLMCGMAYAMLERSIVCLHGTDSVLAHAVGNDVKGKLATVAYAVAIPACFVSTALAGGIIVAVALMWLIPDRRIEKVIAE